MKNEDQIMLPLVSIPESANYQLPDESLLSFYNDLEERIFWIDGEIDSCMLNLVHYILKWNREDKDVPIVDRKPIKLLIHSPGGDLDILGVLYDMIRLSQTPVVGINLGQSYSAAAMILLACHRRYGLKNSTVLFHKGSCNNLAGSYEEVNSFMREYQRQVDKLTEIICARTQFEKEEVTEKMKGDWYLDAQKCVEKNVYDGIITSIYDLI